MTRKGQRKLGRKLAAESRSTREIVSELWAEAGLPQAHLRSLELTGEGSLLPSSFHVAVAAQSTIACAALASTGLGTLRGGRERRVDVDMSDAERECTGYFTLDDQVPDVWAPLSGLYPCADGFVRIHANFDHHRDGVLRLLDIHGQPDQVDKRTVEKALSRWCAVDFETSAAEAGLVVSAARSFEEWDSLAAAKTVANQPLISIDKIGEAAPIELPGLAREARPLSGLRVLDLTRILAGPVCGRTLACHGADVMLINSPHLPNIDAIADTSRGKLSAHIDLDESSGVERLRSLSRDAHLFVESYRPGGLAERGFGPEQLAVIRPGIVCVSLSAYGHEGPWAERRGFDSLVQTASGFNIAEAKSSGEAVPRALPVQILDYASGFLMAFAGQVALLRQQQEGGSWHVQISLAATAHWLRSLGRIDFRDVRAPLGLREHAVTTASGFGKLTAMPHAARVEGVESGSDRPSVRPGTHAPIWPPASVSSI